jgi:subtilisin family serine protease
VRRLALAALVALALPGAADAARYAVGARTAADVPRLLAALPGAESLAPIPAVVVERRTPPQLAALPGAAYVERVGTRAPTARRLTALPNDPLVPRQWHLEANRAFEFWDTWALLPSVKVAVIDSGIDGDHPEFAGRIAAHASFVGGSALVDRDGHGTFVAGLIAANANNGAGIAGMAPTTELLVAKVVEGNDLIDVVAEVQAIRWAVKKGARVINMSLGGLRDPRNPGRDAFSQLEADAVAWAHGQGAVVVAAVGNNTEVPPRPWPFASYPAALPHVLGVSALARDGSVPPFSHRDKIYNDIAAPGAGILSAFPRALTAEARECNEQGYSSCGPEEFRKGQGTSFAAPQVAAAAALLIGQRPALRPEQVTALLTASARDVSPGTGCRACALRRDALTGWGRLDVTAALRNLAAGAVPPRDLLEPNDDAGRKAPLLWGKKRRIDATLDFWDDQSDVYAIKLQRGERVFVSVLGPSGTDTNLILWRPGTVRVDDISSVGRIVQQSAKTGPQEYLPYRAPRAGTYYVQVKLGSRGSGRYRLFIVKR